MTVLEIGAIMFDAHDLLLQTLKSVAGEVGLGMIAFLTAWRMKLWQKTKAHLRTCKARAAAQDKLVASWPNIERVLVGYQDREARITREFESLNSRLDGQDARLAEILAHQWGQARLSPQAQFVCDSSGRNLSVNQAYAKQMRVGEHKLLGFGWKNTLAPESAKSYVEKLEQCLREHRSFEERVTLVRGDGSRFYGLVRLEPYPEDPSIGPATHWFGLLTYIEEAK